MKEVEQVWGSSSSGEDQRAPYCPGPGSGGDTETLTGHCSPAFKAAFTGILLRFILTATLWEKPRLVLTVRCSSSLFPLPHFTDEERVGGGHTLSM